MVSFRLGLKCQRCVCLVGLLGVLQTPGFAAEAAGGFKLQDFLGRRWANEAVRFNLRPEQLGSAKTGHALVGPDNREVPYQLLPSDESRSPAIEFAADLAPFETRVYRFIPSAATEATDLRIQETGTEIRIANGQVGIAIRKRLTEEHGPIAAIRLASGEWIGDSRLSTPQQISSYSIELVARGPVYAEVLCRIQFDSQKRWQLRFRLQAYEPVILVDEEFSLGDTSSFALVLDHNFSAEMLFYRHGSGRVGELATQQIRAIDDRAPVFVLEPWLHWWERVRQGTWFALYNEKAPDLLAIGARDADVWVNPGENAEQRASAQVPLTRVQRELRWTLPLKLGSRRWMIGAFDRDASLAAFGKEPKQAAPLPQQYFIKHGPFSLERIRNYVSQWAGDEERGPRLMLTPAEVEKWRFSINPEATRVTNLAQRPIAEHELDEAIAFYLATGERVLGWHLVTSAISRIQDAVDMFLRQESQPSLGFAPHHQTGIFTAINLADAVWSSEHMSSGMRDRLKAQIAFLAYTVNRPDYWSPARGFSANPNMTTTVASLQAVLACMIRAHPLAPAWLESAMRELKDNQLDKWPDENGGWLEAPHYAMLSVDHLLGAFLATRNAGFNEYLYDPKLKKVLQWLAKISTPPDRSSDGHRHIPPIGNTYMREPSGLFGTVAYLWKEREPDFSAEMQWMHRQQGSPSEPGVGGFFPALVGYRRMLLDPALQEKAPAYTSELFPRTGVILRNHFPSNRETQLYLIAGQNHAHYDRDSGSFTLWGKGRVVANDFGYNGEAPGEDHNMVTGAAAPEDAVMTIEQFMPGADIDYVRGVKQAWERKIAFIKHPNPLGPSYYVMADIVKHGAAVWRTWFTAEAVSAKRNSAHIAGLDDVDTDVFASGGDGALTVHAATRATFGMSAGQYGRVVTAQTGLATPLKPGGPLLTVLYPRLKAQKAAQFTSIAGGNGVKIRTHAGTDYVFLGGMPFVFREGSIVFRGTVGAVLMRGGKPLLWLGDVGFVGARGRALQKAPVPSLGAPRGARGDRVVGLAPLP